MSDLYEFDLWLNELGEIKELDSFTNDDGNVDRETVESSFGQFVLNEMFLLNENHANIYSANNSDENPILKTAPFSNFSPLLQEIPRSICLSSSFLSAPQHVSQDKENSIGKYSTESISESKNCDFESYTTISPMSACNEMCLPILHKKNEVQISTSNATTSTFDCKAASQVNSRVVRYKQEITSPATFEISGSEIVSYQTYVPNQTTFDEKFGATRELTDDNVQSVLGNYEETQQFTTTEVEDSYNANFSLCDSWIIVVPVIHLYPVTIPLNTPLDNQTTRSFDSCGKGILSPPLSIPTTMANIENFVTISGDGNFRCLLGNKKGMKNSNLLETQVSENRCDKFGTTFCRPNERHRRLRALKETLDCDKCGKRFKGPSRFVKHLRTHTREKPFTCDKCDRRFSHLRSLAMHFRTHTV